MTALNDLRSKVSDRPLWTGVSATVAMVLLAFGGVFAIGGIRVAPLPGVYEAIVRYVPGGMHTYGVLMVLLSFNLLHALVPHRGEAAGDDEWAHLALRLIWVFSLIVAVTFGLSWALTGTPTWSGVIYWIGLFGFSLLCWKYPPTDGTAGVA